MSSAVAEEVDLDCAEEYRQALDEFLIANTGETGLMKAYQLGRRALQEQCSILDLAALHQHAMLTSILHLPPGRPAGSAIALGEEFFAEVMAPFEMMHRGYADAIRQLQTINQTLEQRVEQRTRALRESERRNAMLARLYAILSGINSAIVRLRNRNELLQEVCRITVDQGDFPIAWIGMREGGGVVIPVTWCNRARDGSDHDQDRPLIERLVQQAVTASARVFSGHGAVIQRIPDAGAAADYRAYVLLPLLLSDEVVGLFALYTADITTFDAEEMRLLEELAGDLSFALEQMKKEERLVYLAYYDVLTGLPNTDLLRERLERQIQVSQQNGSLIALVFADLVHFSNINDTSGRHVGDQLLRQVGVRLNEATGPRATVARMGADRFAVMLCDLTDDGQVAHRLESEIIEIFERPFRVGEIDIHLSARVGISLYPADADNADTLFRNAEIALKRAQVEGEGYLFYNPAMNERIVHAVTLETKLRKALEQERLIVHYQPKVASLDARVVGFEALIRFADEDGSLVPPAQFIPLLEESGMIIEAGGWVMRRAAADFRRWQGQGLRPPRIAVNVSAIQLRHREFVQSLRDVVSSVGEGGVELDIEITESAVMDEVEENITRLEAAREMGFHIAIDDFGTGYSSLSYLSRLPVNALKIDRSFIITMTESPNALAIVHAIITLAHSLNLEVIAEGVELEEQAKLLRLLRCELIQGNYYGQAMAADQVAALLATLLPGDPVSSVKGD